MGQSSITECNTALDARNSLSNGGSVEIKSGATPDIDSAPTGTVLVTFTLPNPAFNAASNRASSLNAVNPVTASVANTGGTVHYVLKNSGGTIMRSGTAGVSGADMILNTLNWSIGDDVSITAWTTSQPK